MAVKSSLPPDHWKPFDPVVRWQILAIIGILALLVLMLGSLLYIPWVPQVSEITAPERQYLTEQVVLRILFLAGAASFLFLPPGRLVRFLADDHRLTLSASIFFAACWACIAGLTLHTTVDGRSFIFWIWDDGFISLRYARNLAEGSGLVWNDGQYVEGYTNFLWTTFMAATHLLPIPDRFIPVPIMLVATIIVVSGFLPLVRIIGWMGGDQWAKMSGVLLYGASWHIMSWTMNGSESPVLMAAGLWILDRIRADVQRERVTWVPFALMAVASLLRADAAIWIGLLGLVAFWLHAPERRWNVVAWAPLVIAPTLLHLGWRLTYYGEWMPNTAHLKVLHWQTRWLNGLEHLSMLAMEHAILIAFACGMTVRSSRLRSTLLLAVGGYSLYVVSVGGDVFSESRFYLPVLPILCIYTVIGIQETFRHAAARYVATVLCCIGMPLIGISGLVGPSEGNVHLAITLREAVPPDTVLADTWAGVPFYYSDLPGVDLLGVVDPHIANLPAYEGQEMGHNKYDIDWSLTHHRPDIVAGTLSDIALLPEARAQDIGWATALYDSIVFQEHCQPYPLPLDTWRPVYLCDWSPLWSEWHADEVRAE